jgi:hypothetical protein
MKYSKSASFVSSRAPGMFAIFFVLICISSASAQTESVLYLFTGLSDGGNPFGTLVEDAAGNLYGTTSDGGNVGASTCFGAGCGTVYKLSPSVGGGWTETTLYTFTGEADGAAPLAGLTIESSGNLYGTATYGGANASSKCQNVYPGCGVIFEVLPSSGGSWTEKVLYTFLGGSDGKVPESNLTFDGSGNLFGTAIRTGIGNACEGFGCGSVFELSPNGSGAWHFTVLHDFSGGKDGGQPIPGVTLDAAGNIFGTTYQGGESTTCSAGCYGTAFELSPKTGGGYQFHVLHTFTGGPDGGEPYGGLTPDSAGNLIGTTLVGGSKANSNCRAAKPYGCGVVYELSPETGGGYKEKVLYAFLGTDDVQNPDSSVILDPSGNVYGGGDGILCDLCSFVYELSPGTGGTWTETTLYSFPGGTGGGGAGRNGLLLDANGNLDGVATVGGIATDCTADNQCGLVYQIAP